MTVLKINYQFFVIGDFGTGKFFLQDTDEKDEHINLCIKKMTKENSTGFLY